MLEDEVVQAHTNGALTIADKILDRSLRDRFALGESLCGDSSLDVYCLYLYLYALESWCCEGLNFLEEVDMYPILTKVEEMQTVCCPPAYSAEPDLGPSMPIARNGVYTDKDATNPATIALLATATSGTILWYNVGTGGTGTSVAPNLPAVGVYTYWISQILDSKESQRLLVNVKVLPAKVKSDGLNICQLIPGSSVAIVFTGVEFSLNIFDGATNIGGSLIVNTNLVQDKTYTVIQTQAGLSSVPTSFSVTVKAVPVLGNITSVQETVAGVTSTYLQVTLVPSIETYTWTLPGGIVSYGNTVGTVNRIPITIGNSSNDYFVKGTTTAGCQTLSKMITIQPPVILKNVSYVGLSEETTVGRLFTAVASIRGNKDDIISYSMQVIANPMNAVIAPLSGTTSSATTANATHTVSIDATGKTGGGEVHIRFTINSSSLGAPLGTPITLDVKKIFAAEPYCLAGYTLSDDKSFCFKDETMEPEITQNNYCMAKTNISEYAQVGTRIYNPGFTPSNVENYVMPPSEIYAVKYTAVQWKSTTGSDGPMNRAAIWVDSDCNGSPNGLTAGAQTTVAAAIFNAGVSRTIFVGVGGDNNYKLIVNGEIVVETVVGGTVNFALWHIFPVTIMSGTNLINVVGTGDGSVNDAIAMTIYDNTALEISTATTDANLNILFTTLSLVGEPVDIATCPAGWSLDTSGGQGNYICRRKIITPPIT